MLTRWLSELASISSDKQSPIAAAALNELSNPTAPGLCASCHSLEESSTGERTIHWRATDRSAGPRPFTKFNHGPHLLLRELADCTSCHSINQQADTSAAYTSLRPTGYASEFKPVSKQQCAACHTARAAGDHCQSCHNYHVQLRPFVALMKAALP